MYDAHGESHARSKAGFKWAWDIEGVSEAMGSQMSLKEVNAAAGTFREWQGRNMFWLCAPLLADLDDQTVERAWEWWRESLGLYEGFQEGSTVLLEFMQEVSPISTAIHLELN